MSKSPNEVMIEDLQNKVKFLEKKLISYDEYATQSFNRGYDQGKEMGFGGCISILVIVIAATGVITMISTL